jgi:integrase
LNHPQHHWSKLRKTIGMDDVRIHDLRHTLGSLGHMAGLSQREIADMLGHRKMATTERYVHGYDDRKRKNAQVAAERVLAYTR